MKDNKLKYTLYVAGVAAIGVLTIVIYKWIKNRQALMDEQQEGSSEIQDNNFDASSNDNYATDASSQHFTLSEFASKDGVSVPDNYKGNVQVLMNQLEAIRGALNAPITIVSGYRTPEHNKSVGGVPNSQHLYAKAADIKVSGYTPSQVKDTIEKLIANGTIRDGGVGVYPTWVHYDIRENHARWSGGGNG
jgi:hypothetical protein